MVLDYRAMRYLLLVVVFCLSSCTGWVHEPFYSVAVGEYEGLGGGPGQRHFPVSGQSDYDTWTVTFGGRMRAPTVVTFNAADLARVLDLLGRERNTAASVAPTSADSPLLGREATALRER